jgi:hypothetical protein
VVQIPKSASDTSREVVADFGITTLGWRNSCLLPHQLPEGTPAAMADLKLIALDAEDLAVISAHLQDAVMQVGDVAYLPREKRFAVVANRFDWADAMKDGSGQAVYARRRAALRFERVLGAKVQGIDLKKKGAVLSLLAIGFEPESEPAGSVTLLFADGGAIRLQVECIEAAMTDLGPAWQATSKPQHPEDGPAKAPDS